MDPANPAAIGYRNIARRILGESVPLMSLDTGKRGFFGKLKSFLQSDNNSLNTFSVGDFLERKDYKCCNESSMLFIIDNT